VTSFSSVYVARSKIRLLDDLFRTPTAFEGRFRRSAELLYTKVVLFCASLKRIDNAFVFMKQMSNLNLMIPIHLLIDVACHAADVDDSAAVETILQDLNDLTRIVQLVGRLRGAPGAIISDFRATTRNNKYRSSWTRESCCPT